MIWGLIARNPADRISPSADDTQVSPPTAEPVLALFDEAERDNPEFAVFLMMAVVTGARRGALCALRWSDFGVRGVTLARVISDGPVEVAKRGRVKGRAQTIAVASETMVALTAHRQRMAERAQACGVELAAEAYVARSAVRTVRRWGSRNCVACLRTGSMHHYGRAQTSRSEKLEV